MSTSASPSLPTALPAQPSIHALPNPAIRALGSSLALADPCAAVKELVDNALDAGATSVAVDLAPNTLDHVAVRDNGRSVAPADRALLGRRHCTSKLAALDELRVVGARSLGFRGEALASLAGCAEGLWVTVRCEGEGVGRVLRVGRAGEGVVGEEARGCPVGTTVRAEGLFAGLPVRRQAALKHAEREVRRVKGMLQAYALARPGVRLEFKVGKGGRGKGGWLYAPKPGLGQSGGKERVADAAWKVVGKDAAAQCEYAVHEVGGYTIEAFLPRSGAEAKKVSGHGQFLSVDARPVSTTRGTLKLVAKAFRERLKKANPALEDVKEPFLRMDVKCPPGSYDPNVEPAKDDVVFEDANAVLTAVEELLDMFYSSHPATAKSSEEARLVVGSEVRVDEDDIDAESDIFDQLINMPDSGIIPTQNLETPLDGNKKDTLGPETPSIAAGPDVAQSETQEEGHEDEAPRPKRRRTWKYNMYDCDEDDFLIGDDGPQSAPEENLAEGTEEALNDVTLSNPWTMAKINTRVRGTDVSSDGKTTGLVMQRAERQLNAPVSTPPETQKLLDGPQLPTPQTSSPIHGRNSFGTQIVDPKSLSLPHNLAASVPPQPSGQGKSLHTATDAPKRQRRGGSRRQQPGRGGINKPFRSPINPERDNRFSNLPPRRLTRSSVLLRRNEIPVSLNDDSSAVEESMSDGRDRDIRDFMAAGNNRQTRMMRPSTRSAAMEQDFSADRDTEMLEKPVRMVQRRLSARSKENRIRNFEFNDRTVEPASPTRPAEALTQERLTLQNRTSVANPLQEQIEGQQVEMSSNAGLQRQSSTALAHGRTVNTGDRRIQQHEKAAQHHQQSKEPEQRPGNGLIPLRRLSTRQQARRRTTSSLPLERVPEDAQMQDMYLVLSANSLLDGARTSGAPMMDLIERITRSLDLLDVTANALSYGPLKVDDSAFTADRGDVVSSAVVQEWGRRLGTLLQEIRADCEEEEMGLREDLSFVLMEAIERQRGEVSVGV
ncbi:hypothetical protein SLS56_000842 [Neofusicoccum ribis]|uniref:DNA mismatch repair protein S5 domain-containing protein n=1 Tax=Neofusicoccum ribis TaxID=45134 RepID=A0ABR3TC79_9PEZI